MKWNPVSRTCRDSRRSKLCQQAIDVVRAKWPSVLLLTEVKIDVRRRLMLKFDIYIPLMKMVIEVNREQHFRKNSHFHRTERDFRNQVENDKLKKEWCELNDITLIDFDFDETPEQWRRKLE